MQEMAAASYDCYYNTWLDFALFYTEQRHPVFSMKRMPQQNKFNIALFKETDSLSTHPKLLQGHQCIIESHLWLGSSHTVS